MTVAVRPARQTSAEINEAVLDTAAALIARRGVRATSVQAVADATGFSKTGLLRRFPSKDALVDAALQQCVHLTEGVHHAIAATDNDRERDALTISGLVDLALAHPGWAQLVLASIPPLGDERLRRGLARIGDLVSDMFRFSEHDDLTRRARVTGTLGALVTLALTYEVASTADTARPAIIDVCMSTLGYAHDERAAR